VFRVLWSVVQAVDLRIVLLAALIAAAGSFTALSAQFGARDEDRLKKRWPAVASAALGAGIWATFFLAVRSYTWMGAVSFDVMCVGLALVIAVAGSVTAFAFAANGDRWHSLAGGSILGLAILLTHTIALKSVGVDGTLARNPVAIIPINVMTVGLTSAAMVALSLFSRASALAVAVMLISAAICGLHMLALGATSVVPGAISGASGWVVDGSTLAIGVACITAVIMIAARAVTLLDNVSKIEAAEEIKVQHEALRERGADLTMQNSRFNMALSSMPHGLSLIDAEMRLVVCNKKYSDIYGVPPELTKPGTPLETIIKHRLEHGVYAGGDPDTYRAERLCPASKLSVKTYRLNGGRTVLVSRRPTPEGGWIAIHEDITERRRLEEVEREARVTLAAVFDAVPAAIICVAPDRRVMLWSRGAEHVFGYTSAEVVGQPYRLVPPGGEAEFEAYFQRALAGETMRAVQVRRRRKDGVCIQVRFSSAALRNPDGSVRYIVYALDDVTELEMLNARLKGQNELLTQREEVLELKNNQLDAALDNMVQGLAMFDGDFKLVVSNRLYAEIYGLTPEDTRPGTSVREIVERRFAVGVYSAQDGQPFIDAKVAQFTANTEDVQELADGRVMKVRRRRMANGGYLVTHEDVTAPERLNSRLQDQNELLAWREAELNTRNMQLDTALEHMLQGLAMFDSDLKLVLCNRLYTEMYGLTPEQVKPGTPMRDIFASRIKNGTYDVNDAGAFVDSWTNSFGQNSTRTQQLADGRIISVSRGRTADGGRVSTHQDITESQNLTARLQARELQLRETNLLLDAALNNMVQGLAMFDREHRLVVANHRFAELYGLKPDQVKPGFSMREIIEHRAANGDLPGKKTDEVLSAILSRLQGNGECEYTARLANGRYISVSAKPMADGCTVTTHHDITEQRRSEAKIVHMAMHDALTGLANRVLFHERTNEALASARRGQLLAVHFLDLDNFKNVNDTLGHPAGDKLLKIVTGRLLKLIRETDTVARMGGDEFAILQTAVAQPADASTLARRVIETLGEPYEIDGHQVVIGASVGIALGPSDGNFPDQLIRNADLALYRAKADGKGTLSFFEKQMDALIQQRRILESDMRKAMAAGEFELFYQPVVNLVSNDICGCEALIRWRHPTKGLVPPSSFIPLAEELGLIVQLGDWAIREACAAAAHWPQSVRIAVNLSPVQFRSAGLLQTVVGALASSGLAPQRLELEITETILLDNSEATLSTLYRLRELGVCIALDDFGTGYSSLSYLQSFPFDRIKIDRSFIKDIGDGAGSLNIVRALTALATGLGMETTAEGVETEFQRDTVRGEGCTEMQGFLFSPALPVAELEQRYFTRPAIASDERAAQVESDPVPIISRAAAR
jgi:diguanylate cyclase (GGDEF)-like protein/PAS domain S-box-containing protein